jgi:NhaP-type Na+/H+ or K+/H+ antiporter
LHRCAANLSHVVGQPVGERDALVALTYVVVVFSILVQGLTVGPFTRRWLVPSGERGQQPHPERGHEVTAGAPANDPHRGG